MDEDLLVSDSRHTPVLDACKGGGADLAAWSAAIVNFNGRDLVWETIASLKASEPPPAEILLVDDGSTDDSVAAARKRYPDVRIVSMPRHTGRPGAVRNKALRDAAHRYVLLCDNDVQVAPEAVRELMAVMPPQPQVAVCSGVVVCHDNLDLIEGRARPLHFLCWSTGLRGRALADARAEGPSPGVGCGIQLVDREAAIAAGLFDENLAHGWLDDGDLHHRLNLFGYRSLSLPTAVVVHRRARKISRAYGQIHNRWYILLSHYQLRTLIVIAPALLIFELLLIGYMIRSGEAGSYARALRDVAAKLPEIRIQRRKVKAGRRLSDKEVLSALDLDLPRHLRDNKGLAALISLAQCQLSVLLVPRPASPLAKMPAPVVSALQDNWLVTPAATRTDGDPAPRPAGVRQIPRQKSKLWRSTWRGSVLPRPPFPVMRVHCSQPPRKRMPLDPLQPDWSARAPLTELGPIEPTAAGFRARTEAGSIDVSAFAPGILRLTLGDASTPDFGMVVAKPEPPSDVHMEEREDGVGLKADGLRLALRRGPLRLTLWRGERVLLQSTTDGTFGDKLRLPPFARTSRGWLAALALESDEAVFGHGEKWGPLNHRGQLLRSRVEDALGVNAEASYKNTPFVWSPRGWGLFVHTAATVTHGVGFPPWSHRSYVLELADQKLDLFLVVAESPAAILERYTWLTGRPPRPPRWSLGAWFSRAFYKDADEVLATARKLRARRIPADVIVLDGQAWQDNRTRFRFEFDPARYPDPKAFLDELHALHFKVCVWEYPMVSVRGPLFAEFESKGWLLKDRATGRALVHDWGEDSKHPLSPLQPSGLIDFTHPEAYAYWRDGHAKLFELGVDVIKTDFGEQVPSACMAHATADGDELHNVYPLLYHRCVFEATEQARGQGFIFARAGWAGSQRFPTHWGGDPQADWEALAASIRGALSWGLSGGACYATDVGGFLGPPDPELYVRWAQVAVFVSHLRFHGTTPREPWVFGQHIEAIIRDWLELRYRLIPYLEGCLEEAARTGMPVMRAMPLAFPDQPELWAFETQYMFGPSLLVVPILQAGGNVRLRLPSGRWRDLVTGDGMEGGGSLELTFALERFPVFAREDVEIPFGPIVQHIPG